MNYTTQVADSVLIIKLEGDIIGESNMQNLMLEVDEAITNEILLCVVDISKIRYINSSGIGILTTLLNKFRTQGGELVLTRPSEYLQKLLIITKLTAIFTIAESQEEAISKIKNE